MLRVRSEYDKERCFHIPTLKVTKFKKNKLIFGTIWSWASGTRSYASQRTMVVNCSCDFWRNGKFSFKKRHWPKSSIYLFINKFEIFVQKNHFNPTKVLFLSKIKTKLSCSSEYFSETENIWDYWFLDNGLTSCVFFFFRNSVNTLNVIRALFRIRK